MASSIASFPFLIETNAEASILLPIKIKRPLRFPLFVYRPGKCAEISNLNASSFGHSDSTALNYGRLLNGSRRGWLWRTNDLRAIGKSTGISQDDDDAEDVLQSTIEKSKKVLAMQRDLLQRVSFYLFCTMWFSSVNILFISLLKHTKLNCLIMNIFSWIS